VRAAFARASARVLEFPARNPAATLVLAALLIALALVGVFRLRPDTSLEPMFAKHDPAAEALVRVLNRFGAVEELLVLVTVPDAQSALGGPQPGKLVAFAERFEQALKSSPDSGQLVEEVAYRADADTQKFIQEVLVPSGLFYLDDASMAQAGQRLTPDGMRRQLRRNESLLAQPGPAAAAAAKVLLQDPLRLMEFLKPRFASAAGSFATFGGGEDALISPDGRALLVRVIGMRPPSDLEFCKRLVNAATRAAESSNSDRLNVSFGGAYAIATTSERALRADSTSSVIGAFVSLIAWFAVVFRRPFRLLFLAVFPLALGSVLGFGAYAAIDRSMTILSAAVGAMMVGMGIDYSIHYLTHYEKLRGAGRGVRDAAAETSRSLFAVLFAAWITSVMGFAVVGWSDIPALNTFALLGSLGLGGVFVTSLSVVPALVVLTDRERSGNARGNRARLRFSVEPLLGWILRHGRACVAISLIVFVASLAVGILLPGPILPLEPDLSVMHPRPNPALQTQDEIAKRFGAVPGSMLIHLRADSPEQLVALAYRVDERLGTRAARDSGIAGTIGLSTFLPDPAVVGRRLKEITPGEADRVAADFRAAIADSAFDAASYEKYAGFLRELLARRTAPSASDFTRYPRLARTLLPSAALLPGTPAPMEAITLVSLSGTIDERGRRDAAIATIRSALADLPGATLTGLPVLGHDTESRVQRYVPRLFWISVALVLGYVLVHFHSLRDGLLSLTTATFGMVVLLAVMRLAHVRVNLINLLALPLLIGMTVDYGIFLVSLARLGRESGTSKEHVRDHVASSSQAVLVCAGATLLGFGSLIWISVPAVQSLGIVVAVGMLAALCSALFLLAPILLMEKRRP
jgi:predicted RND superfamily exporter protein